MERESGRSGPWPAAIWAIIERPGPRLDFWGEGELSVALSWCRGGVIWPCGSIPPFCSASACWVSAWPGDSGSYRPCSIADLTFSRWDFWKMCSWMAKFSGNWRPHQRQSLGVW